MNQRPRTPMPGLASGKRGLRDEVEIGLGKPGATTEAERCYLCNYKFEIDNDLCIYCDRCLKVMPVDNCIVKASALIFDERDRITGHMPSSSSRDYNMLYLDPNECTRCGACVEVCPVECITLQKVTRVMRPVERA
jgi:formate dehydrogenase major subunit